MPTDVWRLEGGVVNCLLQWRLVCGGCLQQWACAPGLSGFAGIRARGQSVRLKGSSVEGIFVHRISSNKLWYRSPQRARDEDDAAEAFGLAALTDYSQATTKHQRYISSSS